MTPLRTHEIGWVTAAPLWPQAAQTPVVMRRPAILGFGHDGFMDELLSTMQRKPSDIGARVATGSSRSYQERLPGEPYDAHPTTKELKLYQPVHGWFYLVTGSLVCRLPGLPDHPVDRDAGEKAGFVLRRLDGKNELALVGPETGPRSWQPAKKPDALADGEEVLPLFPVGFMESDRRRKLLAGLIPTASQDLLQGTAVGAPPAAEPGPPGPADAFEEVKGRVTGAITMLKTSDPQPSGDIARASSCFILMDLADFLTFQLPVVMNAVHDGGSPGGKAGALVTLFRTRTVDPTVDTKTLADLLKTILVANSDTFVYDLRNASNGLPGELESALQLALEEATSTSIATIPDQVEQPGLTHYVTRLVYQRPQCGPLHPDVVSPPSEPFLVAPYFDPDAPARPIRIVLPFDTSPKGLRKFRKNVKMVLSDGLRKAMNRDKYKDLQGPGIDCGGMELSIPIITIVAMIILFVMISILNIVFFWMPFVKICLPKVKVEP